MMTDWRRETIDTYNRSAQALAKYFKGVGARTDDIERALELATSSAGTARVVELGCGDGRDAAEIAKRANWYEGIDNSEGMIRIARGKVDIALFEVVDMLDYKFPKNLDVVFAFASLLHLNRDEIHKVASRVANALRPGGIFYISLKYRPRYSEEIKTDDYGKRQFFFYTPELIRELAGPSFDSAHEDRQTIGKTEWFTLALRKT